MAGSGSNNKAFPIINEQSLTLARALILIFVAMTFWFYATSQLAVLTLILLYAGFLAAKYFGLFKRADRISRRWPLIVVEFAFALSIIHLTGGATSPWLLMLLTFVLFESLANAFFGLTISFCLFVVGVVSLVWPALVQFNFELLSLAVLTLISGFVAASVVAQQSQTRADTGSVEAIIEQERNKLKILVNSLGEAVLLVDRAGKIVLYNGAALELLDTHSEIIGRPITKVLPLLDAEKRAVDLAAQAIKENRPIIRDDLLYRNGQHVLDIYAIVSPVVENDINEGALILVRDVSRQKTLESQKDEFISIISHELRTPVAVVEADLSTLLVPGFVDLPDKALKLARSAQSNLVFLQSLLQDLSELSQADRSVLDIELNQIEPVSLINEVAQDLNAKAKEAGLTLKSAVADDLPVVFSSKERIKEILVNLVTNAIKYSGKGKEVTIAARPSLKISGGVQLSVTDNGIGMSEADQKKLFAKFFRAENEQTQRIKGTGMGLYISKKQADRIGAKIWLQSKLGVGSTFYLEIPAKIPGDHKFSDTPKA